MPKMSNAMRLLLMLATASLGVAAGTAADDLITELPGADGLDLPNMYSGYLDLPESQKHVFYWLVESTAADPATAPVALWTNGGPGCSGFIGLMTEQGIYVVYLSFFARHMCLPYVRLTYAFHQLIHLVTSSQGRFDRPQAARSSLTLLRGKAKRTCCLWSSL